MTADDISAFEQQREHDRRQHELETELKRLRRERDELLAALKELYEWDKYYWTAAEGTNPMLETLRRVARAIANAEADE